MTEAPLHLTLTPLDAPGRYLLTSDLSSYQLELRPDTLSDYLRRLRPVLVGGNDPSGSLTPPDLLREIGIRLWQALFPHATLTEARESLVNALRQHVTPLLLTFPPTLAELPWELLCDPEHEDDAAFLARQRPLARLVPGGRELPPLAPPLRVLLLISSPPGLREGQRLDVESERAAVEQATRAHRASGFLHLLVEDLVTIPRVQRALLSFKPHIVHFIGHGSFEEGTGGMLWWENEQGEPFPISETHLASLLRPRGLRAVVLHSCKTAKSSLRDNLRGMAGVLVEAGIPAVLAQQANFTYASSQQASDLFYNALCSGLGMAEATFEARQALALTDRPDWAVPTLQATAAGLLPLMDLRAPPGIADPLLESYRLRGGLPAPTRVFVGRQWELRALRGMLESPPGSGPTVALLTGPGGVGKSTLAAQAIVRYGAQYKAALTLSCVEYTSIDLFLLRIGEFVENQGVSWLLKDTLPDPKQSTNSKIEKAVEALNESGPLLLIVDNLESVQYADRTLSDPALLSLVQQLLTNLSNGRVLITGRYRVEGLLPRGKFASSLLPVDLDDLSHCESIQLLERHPILARLSDPVREHLVDEFGGLPYVYDLLSMRAGSASLEKLVHDIQGRLTQEREQRSSAEWQQVRQEAVEFVALASITAFLSKAAYQLLGELSIFRHPFPLEALEQGIGVTRAEWQPLLDYGLLRYDSNNGEYQLHSLTRRFAEGLLDEADRKRLQRKASNWYLRYGRETSHELSDYLEAYSLLRTSGDSQRAGRLALNLGETLRRFGLYTLWRSLCLETVGDAHTEDNVLTAVALDQLGIIAQDQGDYAEARRLYNQSQEIKERLDDQAGRARTLDNLGVIAQNQGDYAEARRLYGQSLEIEERLGDQAGRASTLHNLGNIAQNLGNYAEACRLYNQSLEIKERLDDQAGRASTLHNLGMIAQDQGDYAEARRLYGQCLEIEERLGNERDRAATLNQLGVIAQNQGDYAEAHRLYGQCLEIEERLGDHRSRASTLRNLGVIAQDQGDYEEARRLYGQGLEIQERLGDQNGRADTLHNLGVIAQFQGDYAEARRLYGQSLEIKERLGDQNGRADTLHNLGVIAQDQGDYAEARRLYGQSLEIKERLGDQRGRAGTLLYLGVIAQDQGDYEEARRLYGQGLEIQERLGDQAGRASTLHQLGTIAQDQGDYEEARRLYGQSLEIEERLDDQAGRAGTLHQLGAIAQLQGGYAEARRLYGQSLEIQERLGDQNGRASTLHNLGAIAQLQGDYAEARRLHCQSLEIKERLGDQAGRAGTLHNLGVIAQDQGDYEEAHRLFVQSLEIKERLGDQAGRASTLHNLGIIAGLQGDYEEARRLYGQSLEIQERLGDQAGRASTLHKLGIVAQKQGDYAEARRLYGQSLEIQERVGDQDGRAGTLHELGTITRDQGDYEEARRLYGQSLEIRERLGDKRGRAGTLHQLGIIAQDQGDYEEARRLYGQSLEIEEQLGDKRGRASTLGQLGMLAQQQKDYHAAVQYTFQSLLIFEQLLSPSRILVLRTLAQIRSEMGEAAFVAVWEKVASRQPLPDLPHLDPEDALLRKLVALLRASTWAVAQRIVETHPELLDTKVDAVLEKLIALQQDDRARALIKHYSLLLARCREVGCAAAFAEQHVKQEQSQEREGQAASLNALSQQVVTTLRTGDRRQREALATHLESQVRNFSMDGVGDFLALLAAWLRSEETATYQETLQPVFQKVYRQMKVAVNAEQDREDVDENVENSAHESEEGHPITVEELSRLASEVLAHGTMDDRQRLAANLDEVQGSLPQEASALGTFLGCLAVALRGETPDPTTLEDPFMQLWHEFQVAPLEQHGQQEHQDGGAHGEKG
jgi:tetratricopeptide (TPR) repeat protein